MQLIAAEFYVGFQEVMIKNTPAQAKARGILIWRA
jgi:hypothetical protein